LIGSFETIATDRPTERLAVYCLLRGSMVKKPAASLPSLLFRVRYAQQTAAAALIYRVHLGSLVRVY